MLDLGANKCAFLLRFQFAESIARYPMFAKRPPARVWVFSHRVQVSEMGLEKPLGGMIPYAWWVWERCCCDARLGWIDDRKQFAEESATAALLG